MGKRGDNAKRDDSPSRSAQIIRHSQKVLHDFTGATGMKRIVWEMGGWEYELTRSSKHLEQENDTMQSDGGTSRERVFISYSHKDRKWLDLLKTHLAPFVRSDLLSVWDDTQMQVGSRWRSEIEDALAATKVAVLLVSPHFLASDFIVNNELQPLLEAAETDGVTIFWIPVSSSSYHITPIGEYQAASDPATPLDRFTEGECNAIHVDICRKIKAAVDS